MVKELNTECLKDYAGRIKSAMTRATHNGLTLGWEWEIPMKESESSYDYFRPGKSFSEKWCDEHGFYVHNDSGGREVSSPVFNNVGTARRFAKFIMEAAEERKDAFVMDNSHGACGIHVHTSDEGMSGGAGFIYDNPRLQNRPEQLWGLINLVLNRSENEQFLWSFCGRKKGQSYSTQAIPSKWDTVKHLDMSQVFNHGMVKYNYNPTGNTDKTTTEFRMWGAAKDRLLPAIEFSHSFFRWARDWHTAVDKTDFVKIVRGPASFDRMHPELSDFLPRMSEYMRWLEGTRGYKNLKADLENHPIPM